MKKEIKKIKKKRVILNQIKSSFPAKSINESLSRMIAASLVCQLDPTIDELADIKTAVSEAVTNCIVHGYGNNYKSISSVNKSGGEINLYACYYDDNSIKIIIKDKGKGIEDVKKAMQPLYTTDESGERSGMGFSIMQSFMDKIRVISNPGKGTTVIFEKKISRPV
ncbi:MAG: anti-sigma F factor [Oscillospiraceae bacterium]|nr:anti-sigma F factor [Oscillospiraceae bacterium]